MIENVFTRKINDLILILVVQRTGTFLLTVHCTRKRDKYFHGYPMKDTTT